MLKWTRHGNWCVRPWEAADAVDAWCVARWRRKAELLEGVARTGRFEGVEPWGASGGRRDRVPLATQTALRLFFVAQGLVCVGLAVTFRWFALYVAVATLSLAFLCQRDPPEW